MICWCDSLLGRSAKYQPRLDEERTISKAPGATYSNSGGEETECPITQVLEMGLGPEVSAITNSSVTRSLAGEGESMTVSYPEQHREDCDSKAERLTTETGSEKQGKSDLISSECTELVTNKVEGKKLEPEEEQSPDLFVGPKEPMQPPVAVLAAPCEKLKKSKLERLQEMGVDLTIKPRIPSGDDSFINLDEPESNRGMMLTAKILPSLIQSLLACCYL